MESELKELRRARLLRTALLLAAMLGIFIFCGSTAWAEETTDPVYGLYAQNGNTYACDENGENPDKSSAIDKTTITHLFVEDGVTKIDEGRAFNACTRLEAVKLPEGLTSLGGYMFSGCTNLTTINFPESMRTFNDGEFIGCSSLDNIRLPEGIDKIGNNTFNGCSSIKNINLPEGITYIGSYAFAGCSFTEVTLPSSLRSMGSYAFTGNALEKITILEGFEKIDERAFAECHGLKEVTLPNSLTTIGNDAFLSCEKLESVKTGNGLTTIGQNAFSNCIALNDIKLSPTVDTICAFAFQGCSGLTSIELPKELTNLYDEAFANCTGLTEVSIPSHITGWDDPQVWGSVTGAFENCTSLEKVTFSEGMTSFGKYLFRGCTSLKSVAFPATLASIQEEAFSGCTKLTRIALSSETPPTVQNKAFENIPSTRYMELVGDAATSGLYPDEWQGFTQTKELTMDQIPVITPQTYNGSAITPEISLADGTKDIDYQIIYENNTNQGTATATVTAEGCYGMYTGSVEKNFKINPITATVQSITAEGRAYDGTDDVAITSITLDGIVEADKEKIKVDTPIVGKAADSKAESGKEITLPAGLTLSGNDVGNYTLGDYSGVTTQVEITPAPLTLTGLMAQNRLYDGTTSVTLTGGTLSGVINGDAVTATMPVQGTVASPDVDENKTVMYTLPGLEGADKDNYSLTQKPDITVTISKAGQAALEITTADSAYTPDGIVLASRGGSGTGAVVWSIEEGGTGLGSIEADKLSITQCGSFKLKATRKGDANYNEASVEKTIEVTAATPVLTLNAEADKTVKVGEPMILTAEVKGVGSEVPAGTVTVLEQKERLKDGKAQFTYIPEDSNEKEITAVFEPDTSNYKKASAAIILQADRKTREAITCEAVTATYGDTGLRLAPSGGSLQAGESYAYEVKTGEDVVRVDEKGELSIAKAGRASVTIRLPESDVYTAAETNVGITVNKADITDVRYDDQTVRWDDAEHTLLLTGTLPEGTTVRYENNTHKEPGTYQAKAVIDGGDNYNGLTLTANLTIGLKPLILQEPKTPQEVTQAADILLGVGTYETLSDAYKTLVKDGLDMVTSGMGKMETGMQAQILKSDIERLSVLYNKAYSVKLIKNIQIPDNLPNAIDPGTFQVYGAEMAAGAKEGNLTLTLVQEPAPEGFSMAFKLELSTLEDGKEETAIRLKTPVVIKHAVPESIQTQGMTIHHLNADGSLKEKLTAEINNGTLSFMTTSFSNFLFEQDKPIRQDIDMSNYRMQDKTVTYDGTPQRLAMSGQQPEGIKAVSYEGNAQTDAGVYTVTASFEAEEGYNTPAAQTAVLTIEKAIQSDFQITDENGNKLEKVTLKAGGMPMNITTSGGLADANVTLSLKAGSDAVTLKDATVTPVKEGTAVLVATKTGDKNHENAEVEFNITVLPADATIPDDPDKPIDPDEPVEPDKPVVPETPSAPDVTVKPDASAEKDTPKLINPITGREMDMESGAMAVAALLALAGFASLAGWQIVRKRK
ncbi:leucine-rich repeat protein [Eubacterium limosum]|uniref:leucine-rich repeat protein n=1 Tax=Eubacterium limosum TaxID=1736 RepID=UPI0010627D7A|nr:leucine-rich repeat protein [Eubacterium limosum]